MTQLSFKLDAFEGPLDLLLMLIKKNKVSIYDIPISKILEQYLEVIQQMEELDLEMSSEFLVMAATLLQIKSKMLLPQDEEDQEEEDPRSELVRRLIEYQRIKESLEFFRDHENSDAELFFKNPDLIERPPAEFDYSILTMDNLYEAFKTSFAKLERKMPPPKKSFSGIVGHEKVSVRERVKRLWKRLLSKGKVLFKDIFKGSKSRPEAVASFLAVLEMVKLNKITVDETPDGKDYTITKISDDNQFNFEELED